MNEKRVTLVEMIRDPRMWIYEAWELTMEGHYFIYRYDALEEVFRRATIPSGAADVHFLPLRESDKVPVGGWQVVEKREPSGRRLRLAPDRRLEQGNRLKPPIEH